jgi:hypothetical protein
MITKAEATRRMSARSVRQSASAASTGMLAAMSTERYSVGRATTTAGTLPSRLRVRTGSPLALAASSGGESFWPIMRSSGGTLVSSWPSSRSKVTDRPLISTACERMVASSDTGTSPTTSTLRPLPPGSFNGRPKYSTRSDVAKLTTGALIASCGAACPSTSAPKPFGRSMPMRWLLGCAAATTVPSAAMTATSRTSRWRPVSSSSRRLACGVSMDPSARTAGRSSASTPASSTSTPSSVRFTAASAPLTKRCALPSASAIDSRSPRTSSPTVTVTVAATNTATTPQTAS